MTADAIPTAAMLDPQGERPDPRDPARKTHRMLRQAIRARGDAAPRVLHWAFELFNAAFFDGRLATPLILIAPTSSPRAEGTYTARDTHGLESVIRIAPATMRKGARAAIACLLHECIHAWQHEVLDEREGGYNGHGPKFCEKANAIGAALELPAELRVSPRGREKGTRRPEHWPELPRYEDDPLPERKPAPKGAGDVEGIEEGEAAAADVGGLVRAAVLAERARIVKLLGERALWLRAHKKATSAGALNRAAVEIQNGATEPDAAPAAADE